MTHCPGLMILISSILVSTASAAQRDWTQWRGAQRDGKSPEKGLVQTIPEAGLPLLWKSEGFGRGYSSVTITDGRIFTLGRIDDKECLIAANAEDGTILWATPFGDGDHCNGTPTVDGDVVYAIGLKGDLICARVATGEAVWTKTFAGDFGGKMMSGWGYSESPLVDGDRLIVTPGAKDAIIVALDKRTGDEIWRATEPDYSQKGNDGAGYSSVVISKGAGVKQYVQLTGRGVMGVRAKDGKFLWGYDAVANGTANISTPLVHGDYVFASTGYGTGAALLKLSRDGDGVKASEEYFLNAKDFQNHHGGMILHRGHIYAGTKHNKGFPTCLNMKTGKVVWGGDIRGPGEGSAAVLFADNNLVFRYQNGIVALIKATPDAYELLGSFTPAHQEGKSWSHPVILDGRLYLREQATLMCYDMRAK
jgi:outer membrane protein assembly factor BamB